MKAFTVGLLSLVFLGIGANAAATPVNVVDTTAASIIPEDNTSLTNGTNSPDDICFWAGYAPYCTGAYCPSGYAECGRDSCGGTTCCSSGYKAYCCRINAGGCHGGMQDGEEDGSL
ncbi:hypothetical protein C8Q70DRAFT_190673 [Cubamyces menziesii]|uniref:Uncharacterized protein n=1 Tax=Trametes cubensis TaxID=1111947 RepID=A0AAD7TRG7_9APHY|nr:hypothetical protein C8Q70DRAFT_190673 [Cubamyces menziesii]KAJ8475051.1 hypothetical protein ONZ51_g6802 [Trametes cubensis]